MRAHTAARLARGLAALCLLLALAACGVLPTVWSALPGNVLIVQALAPLLSAVFVGAIALLILTRRPRLVIGWFLLAIALANAMYVLPSGLAVRELLTGTPPGSRGLEWTAWVGNTFLGYGPVLLLFLIFFFPNGQLLPGRRWRAAAWFELLLSAVIGVSAMIETTPVSFGRGIPAVPNPIGVAALAGAANVNTTANSVVFFSLFVLPLASVIVRFRRSRGIERSQLRWFFYVAAVALAVILSTFAMPPNPGDLVATVGIFVGIGVLLPATVGLAVMRYGLYDIEVVISRTLVYGSLAALITGVYVAIAVGLGELVGSGGKPNLGLSILATAIVAVGFQPARERLQRFANRLVYGKRATPYEVLSQFSSRVAETYAGEEVLGRMARVLREGTGAEAATVWLKGGGELRPAATDPEELVGYEPRAMLDGVLPELLGATRVVAVRHQEEVLGALSILKRRGEALTPLEEKLLTDLAHQAGLVLKNVGLTADLQARLEELRLSRQRLVSAQDEARRRLERNLHDGAQQHLVALKVKLGLVEMLLSRDAEKARATLTQLKADADEALETLRDLARGIYPPLLADKGLVAALESQARKATVPVRVEAEGVGRYPQEVEATVYFCVLEALQNVQKYAGASNVRISLQDTGERLHFVIEDDGIGFEPATVRRGAGITNMEDRLDALGGSLEVVSRPGRGTRLRCSLPLAEWAAFPPIPLARREDLSAAAPA